MEKYYLGIDIGGTYCKAVVFDNKGTQIGKASSQAPILTPKEGHTERDMELLWDLNCTNIRNAIDDAKISGNQIKAIACTGHGKGLYLWGKNNKPCRNGILSTDTRAASYVRKWDRNGIADIAFKKTFQRILSCQPIPLLSWLKDNQPEIMPAIKWIFEAKDYIRFRMTDQAFAEITDYSGSGLMNLETRSFDYDLLQLFGLEDLYSTLPPLKKSTEICGAITESCAFKTGLEVGTPVVGGMFDIDACAIAMNITDENYIAVIAGTWSINEYISKTPILDNSIMMNSLYCLDEYYLVEECSPTSASNHSWFIDMFMSEEKKIAEKNGENIYQMCDEMASNVMPDEQNIIFLPHLYGSHDNPNAKACIIGMDSHNTKEHIIRAIMENIAFGHKVHLEKLTNNEKNFQGIRLAGGAARSNIWAQIFADVLEFPIEIINTDELGALGCAIAASVAVGEFPSLRESVKNMVSVQSTYFPNDKNFDIYRRKYKNYIQAYENLNMMWT